MKKKNHKNNSNYENALQQKIKSFILQNSICDYTFFGDLSVFFTLCHFQALLGSQTTSFKSSHNFNSCHVEFLTRKTKEFTNILDIENPLTLVELLPFH